jgi:hypothetical protein
MSVRAYDSNKITLSNQDYRKFFMYRYLNESRSYQLTEWNLRNNQEQLIVDGYIGKTYVAALIRNGNNQVLQVHSLQDPFTSKLVSAVSQNVSTFDCSEVESIMTCFAVQRSNRSYYAYYQNNKTTAVVTSDGPPGIQFRNLLVQIQISIDNQMDLHRQIDIGECQAEKLLLLSNFLVVSCPSYAKGRGRVVFINRMTMKIIKEYIGEIEGIFLGQYLSKIETKNGV